MGRISVETTRQIPVEAARVFTSIADFKTHRPQWLLPAYSELQVEQGGIGAGTIVRYRLKVGPRERAYRMQIAEPKPGVMLTEQDATSSLLTTWTVSPNGTGCTVAVASQWNGAGGIGGFFERLFAPRGLRRLYDEQLARLASYAADHSDHA